MTWRISYVPGAERDIDEAIEYLTSENPTAAAHFVERLALLETRLAETPLMYPQVSGPIRGVRLHPFRYIVRYRIFNDDVVILGCFHASRSPRLIRRILTDR